MEQKVTRIPVSLVTQDASQPRQQFDDDGLKQLAASISAEGLLVPITVRKNGGEKFVIVAGERRFRAMQMLGWPEVPAHVMEMDDRRFRKLQMLENVVRRDLNCMELARGVQQMLDENIEPGEIAATIGKDAGYVGWIVQLLKCNDPAQHLLAIGELKPWVGWHLSRLSANGQARALRTFQLHPYSAREMVALCEYIYAIEHQSQMFDATDLTSGESKMLRSLEKAFTQLHRAIGRLQVSVKKRPGVISGVKLIPPQVRDLSAKVRWLENEIIRVTAVNEAGEINEKGG